MISVMIIFGVSKIDKERVEFPWEGDRVEYTIIILWGGGQLAQSYAGNTH